MKRILISILMLGTFVVSGYGQKKLEIHTGLSIPTGSFADNSYDNFLAGSGNAATGFNAGIKYFYHLRNVNHLSFTLGADIIQNGMSQNFKDQFQQSIDYSAGTPSGNYGMNVKVKYSNYINIPVLAGYNYEYPINSKLALFADACLGFNIASVSDLTMTAVYSGSYQPSSQTVSMVFSTSNQFATQIGGGILINNFSIGLHFNQLGSYDYNGKIKSPSGSDTDFKSTKGLNINTFTLAVGLRFN